MLKYIMGGPSTGKTKFCLEEIIELEKEFDGNILYLVPEQATLQAERNLIEKNGVIIKTQVLSFNRLCFYIFNELGNEKKILLEDIGKNMLLKKILSAKDLNLNFFGNIKRKNGFIDNLGEIISEFYKNDISAEQVFNCLNEFDESLKIKLNDLVLIYKKYDDYMAKKYLSADNILDILAQKIFESGYLKKIKIFIDGFDGFSEQEYKVINELMRVVSEIFLTVNINFEEGHEKNYKVIKAHDLFFGVKKMVNKISELAAENNLLVDEILSLKKIYKTSDEIKFLTKNFFSEQIFFDDEKKDIKDISLYETEDLYEEIELVAKKIIFYVKNGFRFKDIVVITENLEDYGMFIERIFSLYKIPFFIDKKIGIMNNELVNFIRAVFDIVIYNFNYESVFGFLKNNLAGFNLDDMDLLENYVLEFGIKNDLWNKDWFFGFEKKYDEQEIKRIKSLVCEKFEFIKKNLSMGRKYKVEKLCRFVFEMLDFFDVKKKLLEYNREMNLKVWNKICLVFEKIFDIFGNEKIDLKRFKEIMDEGLKKIDLGLIPEFIDEVIVGNIKRTRIDKTKILFIVGANEGFLSKNIKENEIINDDEKIFLNGFGLNFFERTESIILKNNFLLYWMICKAEEKINISCCLKDKDDKLIGRDEIFERIKNLFGNIKINCDKDDLENIFGAGDIFNQAIKIILNEKREKKDLEIYNLLRKDCEYKNKILRLENLVFKNDCENRIERKKILNLSVSQLEKFARCPFSYFLKYDLKLLERKIYELKSIDLGIFLHGILKEFFLFVKENNLIFECEKNLDEYINIAIEKTEFNKNIFFESAYYKFVLFNVKNILCKSIRAMLKNIYKEKYLPDEFEFEFKNIEFEKNIFLVGKVDRVDVLDLNSEKYLRVIDYKSGEKSFSKKNIEEGLDLQLLIYLKILCDEKKIKPGGAYYFYLNDPIVEINNKINDEKLEQEIESKFEMRGAGTDKIKNLIHIAFESAKNICHEIRSGDVEICPHDKNSCLYCEYYSVCRKRD